MAFWALGRHSMYRDPPMDVKLSLLDNNNPKTKMGDLTYFPGGEVSGMVQVRHMRDIFSFGFKVMLEGKISVRLKDKSSIFNDGAQFLSMEQFVFGNPERRQILHPESHKFPFTFVLPKQIPPSFYSTCGWIEYKLSVALVTMKGAFKKASKFFEVSLPPRSLVPKDDDTLEEDQYAIPINFVKVHPESGSKFRLLVPKNNFKLEEGEIPFKLKVEAKSYQDKFLGKVSLIQVHTYKIKGMRDFTERKELYSSEMAFKSIPGTQTWEDRLLIGLDRINPTNFGFANKYITLDYYLRVEISSMAKMTGFSGEIPVAFGRGGFQLDLLMPNTNKIEDGGQGVQKSRPVLTSRISSPQMLPRRQDYDFPDEEESGLPLRFVRRRLSSTSISSHPSLPSYSCLSLASIETLPPSYSEATSSANPLPPTSK